MQMEWRLVLKSHFSMSSFELHIFLKSHFFPKELNKKVVDLRRNVKCVIFTASTNKELFFIIFIFDDLDIFIN